MHANSSPILSPISSQDPHLIFPGTGEVAALLRTRNWETTPPGLPSEWPINLRVALGVCLSSKFPMNIWWGEDLTLFYNDAYISFLGRHKHPFVLGGSGRDAWPEIWHMIGPMIERVQTQGEASWSEDILMFFDRALPQEEVYVTFSFSPIFNENGTVDGLFCACTESTEKIIGNRRLETLRRLVNPSEDHTWEATCQGIVQVLASNAYDIPFAAIYSLDRDAQNAYLSASTKLPDSDQFPKRFSLDDSANKKLLKKLLDGRKAESFSDLQALGLKRPCGPWPEPVKEVVILPIVANADGTVSEFIVAGVSPRRVLDSSYFAYFELIAGQVGTTMANARAYEFERMRAAALTEIGQAKTRFFSNIGHEFRTPLTLILSPLQDALYRLNEAGDQVTAELVTTAHRNARRLQKLVNTLLEFSRIESRRMHPKLEATDLASNTLELSGMFRSLIEREGLEFTVHCESLPYPVYVDREMWEKIVLNLLSNSFKFTFHGKIEVSFRSLGDELELLVTDTGVGIASNEIPHIFERFHRAESTRSRTHDGSGIGLSMVQELVQLLGGDINLVSEIGIGTTVRVRIPARYCLDAKRIAPPPSKNQSPTMRGFIDEAESWTEFDHDLEKTQAPQRSTFPKIAETTIGAQILVAEDNADLRAYLKRILGDIWIVDAVADGRAALEAWKKKPYDLVLSDVMMPQMNGIELLNNLRSDPKFHHIPFILLSARAGEESLMEGLETGADDYLIKPFSAKEIVARVASHLRLAAQRLEVEDERAASMSKSAFLANMSHEIRTPIGVMMGFAELMLKPDINEKERERYIFTILRNGRLLTRLIDDILDLSKVEAGKLSVEMIQTSLGRIVDDVYQMFENQANKREVELLCQAEGDVPETIMTDPMRLQQILVNLVSNALKFTSQGKVKLIVAARPKPNGTDGAGEIVFRVEDSGIGIALEQQKKLFHPFVQADVSTTRKFGGSGLGLVLSRKLAEALGGTVELEWSEMGKGSTFCVRISTALMAGEIKMGCKGKHPKDNIQPLSNQLLQDVNILLVDDGPDLRYLMTEILEGFGAHVDQAKDGWEAVEQALTLNPDIVLMDLQMPDCDGFKATEELRRRGFSGPVIAVSAAAMDSEREKAFLAGCDDHISKPIDISNLIKKIASYTQKTPAADYFESSIDGGFN